MSWNAYVAIACNGKINDSHWNEVKAWGEVQKVWSSMGEWDFWLALNEKVADVEGLESFVFKLRNMGWVDKTCTWWWKEV